MPIVLESGSLNILEPSGAFEACTGVAYIIVKVSHTRNKRPHFKVYVQHDLRTAVVQWLRCCAKNGKVAGSIPDGVNGIISLT